MSEIVKIGNVEIGGGKPVAIQSMANIKTSKIKEVIEQIKDLYDLGCDIIRVSVKDEDDVKALSDIKKNISIPLVADIHFNYKFALAAIDAGVDKIRINPGNIGSMDKVKAVVRACQCRNIPISGTITM